MGLSLHYWLTPDSTNDVADRLPDRRSWRTDTPVESNAAPTSTAPTHANDDALTARVRAGDDEAFGMLYTTHYAALAEYAASLLGDPAPASDIVQDVFLNIWRQRVTWAPEHVGAYLFTAVRHRALNHIGAARRHSRLHDTVSGSGDRVPPGVGEPPLPPDETAHLTRFRIALEQAIDTLPATRREVALLRWRHGKSLAEIAAITGSSVKAVSMQLARTRATLQPIIDTYLRDA